LCIPFLTFLNQVLIGLQSYSLYTTLICYLLVFAYYLLYVISQEPEFALDGFQADGRNTRLFEPGQNPGNVAVCDCGYLAFYCHALAPDFNLATTLPPRFPGVKRFFAEVEILLLHHSTLAFPLRRICAGRISPIALCARFKHRWHVAPLDSYPPE
jgi:hypothetical protein